MRQHSNGGAVFFFVGEHPRFVPLGSMGSISLNLGSDLRCADIIGIDVCHILTICIGI
jgi:hypothetical protein